MEINFAIDTNRYIDLCNNNQEVLQAVETANKIYCPIIIIAELRAGFAHGKIKRDHNEAILNKFLQQPGIFTLHVDLQTTYFYVDLYSYLRKKGTPIPINDLWIASLAIQHNLPLYTRDSDFDHIPHLIKF